MPLTVNVPTFGAVPRTRTKYVVATIGVSGTPLPTALNATSVGPDFLHMTPMAALGWQSSGTGRVERTALVSGDFPVRLVVGFRVPQGNTALEASLRVTAGADQLDIPCDITPSTGPVAKISLLLDRSASMSTAFCGSTSLAQATEGVRVALALMADQDYAELILFAEVAARVVPMARLGDLHASGRTNREEILFQLPSAVLPNTQANIPRAVGLADATSTARIVFTDCNTTLPSLSLDSNRFVLAVPNRNTAVYNAVGGGRCLAVADTITAVGDTRMNVRKFASQILLEATNTSIAVDPKWVLGPGEIATLDFTATELDQKTMAIAFTDRGRELDFQFMPGHADAPSRQGGGREALQELDPEQPASGQQHTYAGVHTVVGDNLVLATLNITPELRKATESKFHVRVKRKPNPQDPTPLPFTLSLATDSDLTMNAQLHSSSLDVGADLLFSAVVSEAGMAPCEAKAHVELTYPDGEVSNHDLEQGPPGRFNACLRSMRPGDYLARFLVEGETVLGTPFVREQSRALTLRPAGARCSCESSR
jgi:hypothetical protein